MGLGCGGGGRRDDTPSSTIHPQGCVGWGEVSGRACEEVLEDGGVGAVGEGGAHA